MVNDQPFSDLAERIAVALRDENPGWLIDGWHRLPPGWGYGLLVQLKPDNSLRNRAFEFYLRICDNGVLSINRIRISPNSMDRFGLKLDEPDSLIQLALTLVGPPFGVTLDPTKF
ncbi:MAG TPA: hypothetical protein VND64_10115 [Pirellulales bacterium]|nr:hypothetical protein [Pirellulales bacterium]